MSSKANFKSMLRETFTYISERLKKQEKRMKKQEIPDKEESKNK